MKNLLFFLLAVTLVGAHGARAHDNATLDATPAPHGGQLRMTGPYHFELVAGASELSVYVTDHGGTKVSTQGATGTATIMSGDVPTSVPLEAAGDNLVKGSGEFSLAPDTVVMVAVTFPGKSPEMARFTPLRKAAPDMHMHHAMH
jgi:hypothetical protein